MVCNVVGVPKSIDNDIQLVSGGRGVRAVDTAAGGTAAEGCVS